jgi:hypothetical protein
VRDAAVELPERAPDVWVAQPGARSVVAAAAIAS